MGMLVDVLFGLVLIYFAVYPQKFPSKWKPRTIRTISVIFIILEAASYLSHQYRTSLSRPSDERSSEIEKLNNLAASLKEKMSTYPDEVRTSFWSLACARESKKRILADIPAEFDSQAGIIAEATCDCMRYNLRSENWLKASEKALAQGEDFKVNSEKYPVRAALTKQCEDPANIGL